MMIILSYGVCLNGLDGFASGSMRNGLFRMVFLPAYVAVCSGYLTQQSIGRKDTNWSLRHDFDLKSSKPREFESVVTFCHGRPATAGSGTVACRLGSKHFQPKLTAAALPSSPVVGVLPVLRWLMSRRRKDKFEFFFCTSASPWSTDQTAILQSNKYVLPYLS